MLTKTTSFVVLVLAVMLFFSEAYRSRQYRGGRWNRGRMMNYNHRRTSSGYSKANDTGVTVCENGQFCLYCSPPSTILISQSVYGRTTDSACLFGTIPLSTNCTSAFSDAIVKGLCNGLQICCVLVSTLLGGLGGDPCPGTFKYINVTYSCV